MFHLHYYWKFTFQIIVVETRRGLFNFIFFYACSSGQLTNPWCSISLVGVSVSIGWIHQTVNDLRRTEDWERSEVAHLTLLASHATP